MKNIEKSTDSISSNELALLSGRIPEVEYPKKAFELKDVLVLPCKTENVFLFLDRIAKDTRYQQGFCDARRAFMERAAVSSDAILRSTAAQALDLGLDTVRLLANDNDEQVCEDLADNPAFLQLPAEEQVRFCRAHIDCLETVVRTYCYRTDAHTDFAAAPELYLVRRVVAEMNDLPLCLEKQLAEDAFASVGNRLTQRAAEKAAND